MRTIRIIVAVVVGWHLADGEFTLERGALWAIAASLILTLLTLVVQHWTIAPAARSQRGLTVFRGQFARLFLATLITITVTAVVVVFLGQRLR